MAYLFLLTGLSLLLLTATDLIKTTLSAQGGGWSTHLLARAVWRGFFGLAGGRGTAKILDYAGLTILLSMLLSWIAGLWGGLWLVLLTDAGSIINSSTHAPASAAAKLYYAGYVLSTLGNGDYAPAPGIWQLVTDVASFAGLVFITTSITYFVPVLSAVSLQRRLSLYVNGLGATPPEIVANSWNGTGFSAFLDSVPPLCQLILQHALNHHAYPVIHYFHRSQPRQAVVLSLVKLAEAQLLLAHALPPAQRPNQLHLRQLRAALDDYLAVVPAATTQTVVPAPETAWLAARPLLLLDRADIRRAYQPEQPRRARFYTLLTNDGWTWQQVYAPES